MDVSARGRASERGSWPFKAISAENGPPDRFLIHLRVTIRIHLLIDGAGLPMSAEITPGQDSDYPGYGSRDGGQPAAARRPEGRQGL